MATKELYHIIVINEDGENELPEARTLSESIKTAKTKLAEGNYTEVKIYLRHEAKRHYIRLRNGKIINLPTGASQTAETPQISTIDTKVESLSIEYKTTAQSQNKCRVSSVLATAHELYNAAFIGSTQRIY